MKLRELIQHIYFEPSLITPSAHASIRQLLEARWLEQGIEAREPGKGPCGEKVAVEQAFIDEGGIAHIPIGGVIGKNLSPFDRGSGAVDVTDVTRELAQMEADPRVRGIILDFDSPGGMVMGTPELAQAIARLEKDCYAFTEGSIASAAYWLAAATDGIFTTMTGSAGAIGVYMPWVDQTKAFEAEGLHVELIKSGKFKGMGFPGTALSDEQKAHLQGQIDELGAMFRAHVGRFRPGIARADMEGQMFMGSQAVKNGFADAVVRDKAEMIRMLF